MNGRHLVAILSPFAKQNGTYLMILPYGGSPRYDLPTYTMVPGTNNQGPGHQGACWRRSGSEPGSPNRTPGGNQAAQIRPTENLLVSPMSVMRVPKPLSYLLWASFCGFGETATECYLVCPEAPQLPRPHFSSHSYPQQPT